MKNYFKKSKKKGFTLVELLAVIVILALLIIITANTILPMLGRTKETGMVTYAKRVLNNAVTSLEADKITKGDLDDGEYRYYRIKADLTQKEDYIGCVRVRKVGTEYQYQIKMFTKDKELRMIPATETVSGVTSELWITDITNLDGKLNVGKTIISVYDDIENSESKCPIDAEDDSSDWSKVGSTIS